MNDKRLNICGCKLIELPFLVKSLSNGRTLIVGERDGGEGVIQSVMSKVSDPIDCTDIENVVSGSIIHELIVNGKVNFYPFNFLDYPEHIKYRNIVCINVLEHFGMCWGDKSDVVNWNWDLKGLEKMMRICLDKIILTVPAGPSIFYGDTLESGVPFLRRYDLQRMSIIKQLVVNNGFAISKENLYYSPNLVEWGEVDFETLNSKDSNYQLTSPNFIWASVIQKI